MKKYIGFLLLISNCTYITVVETDDVMVSADSALPSDSIVILPEVSIPVVEASIPPTPMPATCGVCPLSAVCVNGICECGYGTYPITYCGCNLCGTQEDITQYNMYTSSQQQAACNGFLGVYPNCQ